MSEARFPRPHYELEGTVVILVGEPGETGPIYTRLLATSPRGPHRGTLFLTAEVYRDVGSTGPVFPIWRSSDDGRNWEHVSDVRDEHFGFGNRYQPTLYELPREFAGLPAGTLLLAGSAIPPDMSETHLVLYSSIDGGATWSFVSEIDAGGAAVYDPAADAITTAIWEPDLSLVGNELVCAYADERYKEGSMLQTLVHRSSGNLIDWSDRVLDFGVPDSFTRPGMFVSTGELPDGTYRAVFELVGPPNVPVHFASSPDGEDWGSPESIGVSLISDSGTTLAGSPNLAWRSTSDDRVEILVTGRLSLERDGSPSNSALFNADGGSDVWQSVPLPVQSARELDGENSGYSQSLVWTDDGSIVQATTVRNQRGSHDIVVARAVQTHRQ